MQNTTKKKGPFVSKQNKTQQKVITGIRVKPITWQVVFNDESGFVRYYNITLRTNPSCLHIVAILFE